MNHPKGVIVLYWYQNLMEHMTMPRSVETESSSFKTNTQRPNRQ